MHELFQNKGSSSCLDNYRDIMLGSIPGKCFSSHIRRSLVPMAKVLCGGSQFGSGFNGGETAFAHLYVRLFFDYCKFYKTSCALIFMDIVTAFAVLLRRIIFDDFDNDEIWLRKLSAAGFSSDDIECIIDNVSDRSWVLSVVGECDGDNFVWRLLNQFYRKTLGLSRMASLRLCVRLWGAWPAPLRLTSCMLLRVRGFSISFAELSINSGCGLPYPSILDPPCN